MDKLDIKTISQWRTVLSELSFGLKKIVCKKFAKNNTPY